MRFKKLTGILTALACVGTLTTLSSVSALEDSAEAVYDNCDVNRDGEVDILDAIIINKYLVGSYYIPDENQKRLDTNQNQIIDDADADCVMAKIVGADYKATFLSREQNKDDIPFPANLGFTSDFSSSLTVSYNYLKHVYASGVSTTYPLNPSTTPLSTQAEIVPYGQVGPTDDRRLSTNASENTGIVQIEVRVPSTTGDIWVYTSTGFIVDDHTIATAAHCVYTKEDPENGIKEGIYTPTIKTYNSNGKLTGKTLTPVEVHLPVFYQQYKVNGFDYALVTVKDDLSNYTHFSLSTSYNVTDDQFDHVPIYVTGYKDDELYTDEGRIDTSVSNLGLLRYDTDTDHGQSGAPVYTITKQTMNGKTSYVYTALAINAHPGDEDDSISNAYLYNQGVRMTKYLTQFYLGNKNIGW